jgi:hypothetical protein
LGFAPAPRGGGRALACFGHASRPHHRRGAWPETGRLNRFRQPEPSCRWHLKVFGRFYETTEGARHAVPASSPPSKPFAPGRRDAGKPSKITLRTRFFNGAAPASARSGRWHEPCSTSWTAARRSVARCARAPAVSGSRGIHPARHPAWR